MIIIVKQMTYQILFIILMFKTPLSRRPPLQNSQQSTSRRNSTAIPNQRNTLKGSHEILRNTHQHSSNQRQNILKSQTHSILEQLSQSSLLIFCQKFESSMIALHEHILTAFLELQCKIADCQKKFNAVELIVEKKTKQLAGIFHENIILMQCNKDIDGQLKKLKESHELAIEQLKNNQLSKAIRDLKNKLDQVEFRGQKCEFCEKQLNEIVRKSLAEISKNKCGDQIIILDNVRKVLEVVLDSSPEFPGTLSQYAQEKIIENMDLKCQIAKLKLQKIEEKKNLIKLQPIKEEEN